MTKQRILPAHWEESSSGFGLPSATTNGFPMTDWGLVLSAGAESRAALERLCRVYWGPAYALVRRRGYGRDAALGLIREFFAGLVEENAFSRVEKGSQPFRVWLLAALEEFLIGHPGGIERTTATRDVPADVARADEADAIDSMSDRALAPRLEYERVLALSVLERALIRLERAQAERGQSERFVAFKRWLVAAPSPEELASIARALGLTPASARTALHTLRQRLGSFVQDEISNLLERRDDAEGLRAEMDALLGALAS